MVQQNRRGGGQHRRQNQQRFCPMCPSGNARPLPKDRPACYECLPEYFVTASLTSKGSKHQILVRTLRNSKPQPMKFSYGDQGVFSEAQTGSNGSFLLTDLESAMKERTVTFHLIDGDAEDVAVRIPGTEKEGTPPPTYRLEAIRNQATNEWQVNLTLYKVSSGKPAVGIAGRVDVFDEGSHVWPAEIDVTGTTIALPFWTRDRMVRFSVAEIKEREDGRTVRKNIDVVTKELELPGVNINKARRRHQYDPALSAWENISAAIKGAKGEMP